MPQSSVYSSSHGSDVTSRRFVRKSRLTHPAQYRQVFEKNYRSSDRYWTLLFRINNLDFPRLGLAVAKKRAKKAVDRNRLKRVIRESFRNQQVLPGVDIVVLPRTESVAASNVELRQSLEKQWSRIAKKCAD